MNQRQVFFEQLYENMKTNKDIFLLVGDLGYGYADKIREDFPDRFVNCGAAEFAMAGIASGLALEGKIPFVYTITPFLIYRSFEMLRTYIDHDQIPVKLVGSGRDTDYAHDGYSHNAEDTKKILDTLPNINQLWPNDESEIEEMLNKMVNTQKPYFISLKR